MRSFRVFACSVLTLACAAEGGESPSTTNSVDRATESAAGSNPSTHRDAAATSDASLATNDGGRMTPAGEHPALSEDERMLEKTPCEHRQCDPLLECPSGCSRNGDNVCVDAGGARCDGCPDRTSIGDGDACATPGKSCYYPPACGGDEAVCQPSDDGVPRWVVFTRLC